MERLIELLNEYDPYMASDGEVRDNFWYFIYKGGSAIFPKEIGKLKIISKEYGFIKRLVENDKIDFDKVSKKEIEMGLSIVMIGALFIETNWVLMLLSISDTPIKDLILYLK